MFGDAQGVKPAADDDDQADDDESDDGETDDEDEDDEADEEAEPVAPQRRSAADVLFGDAPPAHQSGPASSPGPATRTVADRMFGAATGTKRPTGAPAARPKSQAERLFGDAPEKYLDLKDNLAKLGDHEGLTLAQQRQEAGDYAQLASNDLQLERPDAHRLFDLITNQRLKGATEDWTAQAARWPAQSRQQLREQFGAAEGESLAAGVAEFIDSKPDLARRLAGGLRMHPDVVRMLAPILRKAR